MRGIIIVTRPSPAAAAATKATEEPIIQTPRDPGLISLAELERKVFFEGAREAQKATPRVAKREVTVTLPNGTVTRTTETVWFR